MMGLRMLAKVMPDTNKPMMVKPPGTLKMYPPNNGPST